MHHASTEHPARTVSRALAERASAFCETHLPREGRFWRAGDLHGAPGRTVWVCLAPPGRPGRWQDDATGMRGDLLDLLRRRLGAASLGPAIDHARAFLKTLGPAPTPPPPPSQQHPRSRTDAALRLWNLCRPLDGSHAEDSPSTRAARRLLERCRTRTVSAHLLAPFRPSFELELLERGPQSLAERIRAKNIRRHRP